LFSRFDNGSDNLGRPSLLTNEDGTFSQITYWGATTNKRTEAVFTSIASTGWVWSHTTEYYEDGTTPHKEWFSVGHSSEDTYCEYNEGGSLTKQIFDTAAGNGTISRTYGYDEASGYISKVKAFVNKDFTGLYTIRTHYNNETNREESITIVDTGAQTTYVYDDSDDAYTLEKLMDRPQYSGDFGYSVYFNYIDGTNKFGYEIRGATETDGDGALSYIYSYYSDLLGGGIHYKYCYADQLWGDTFATADNEDLLKVYEYNTTGQEVGFTGLFVSDESDTNEMSERLDIQDKLRNSTTPQGGFIFTAAMAGETANPFNLPLVGSE
jgi:hypothetical protein